MMRHLVIALAAVTFLGSASLMAEDGRPEIAGIAKLIAMRLALAREVAWSKCNFGIPVADPAREASQLTFLKKKGSHYSMTPNRVTAFFLPQIVASRRYQEELILQWRSGFPRPQNPPLDIQSELRPRIDRLDDELLRQWAAFPRDQLDDWSRKETERLLLERGIPLEVARIASRPLGNP